MTPLKPGQVFQFHSCYQMRTYRGQRHKPDKNPPVLRQTLTPSVHSSSLQTTSQFCQWRTRFKTRVIIVIMSLLYTGYGSAERVKRKINPAALMERLPRVFKAMPLRRLRGVGLQWPCRIGEGFPSLFCQREMEVTHQRHY